MENRYNRKAVFFLLCTLLAFCFMLACGPTASAATYTIIDENGLSSALSTGSG